MKPSLNIIFSFLVIVFTTLGARAQYTQERIAIGTLEGAGMEQQTLQTPSGYEVSIEFMPTNRDEIQLSAFISKNKKAVSGAMQVFIYNEDDIDGAFPKSSWDPNADKVLSRDGFIYLVTREDSQFGPLSNLAFIEINKKRELRISFLLGAKESFRANGMFTEQWINKKDPAAPKLVITTDWVSL